MRRLVLVCLVLATGLVITSGRMSAQVGSPAKISNALSQDSSEPQKAWVFFSNTKENCLKRLEKMRVNVRTYSRWFNAVSVEATGDQLKDLADLPFVLRIEPMRGHPKQYEKPTPVHIARERKFSGDSGIDYGPSKDQAEQIGVPELHKKGLSGKGVVVALLDVGFQWTHEAFATHVKEKRLKAQWDFVMNDGNVERDNANANDFEDEHGTMTWSVLGGYSPGRVVGPAYGATFLLARTEDARSETPAEEDFWIAALEWAEANGANIVSSSLGYRDFDRSSDSHPYSSLDGNTLMISKAANIAMQRGVLIVNSMGNEGPEDKTLVAPADSFGILSIGAVSKSGALAYFSSRGPTADGRIKPDVVARGVRNYLATDTGYGQADGTSFSCPLTAGAAALVLEAHPNWKPQQVMQALRKTASQSNSPDNKLGYGLVNVARAVNYSFEEPIAMRR